jgi:protein TonB
MLQTLLESKAPRQRRTVGTVTSIAIHTALIGTAIVGTAAARTDPPRAAPAARYPRVVFPVPYDGRQLPSGPSEPAFTPPIVDRIPTYAGRIVFPTTPGPKALIDIDPRRLLAGDTTELGLPSGPLGRDRPSRLRDDQPATGATVDRAAVMLTLPRPRYPESLRAAGVTGRVVVRMVVDTVGRVEPGSVVIRESSHDPFAQAVRAVLPALRFRPAETGGRKVRMLVELPFEFRLDE